MKIIIFGKNGQLGAELYKIATDRKYKVRAFSHKEVDITDTPAVKKIIKSFHPDIVMNATTFHVLAECEKNPQETFLVNAIAVQALSKLCQEYSSRFVTYSSDYVFDGIGDSGYFEYDRPSPLQIYGISKVAGEYGCLNYCEDSMVIRTSGMYGGKKGSRAKKGNFVLNTLRSMQGVKTLEVASEQIVSPTYAFHLAKASLDLAVLKKARGIFHLTNSGYCSWAEFAQEIARIRNLPVMIYPVNRGGVSGGAKRPLFGVLHNKRAKDLGITLPSWQEGVNDYLQTI